MSIDWTAFTWQAFATLCTGGMAVGSAFYIGLRQIGIASKQIDIAGRQAEISGQQSQTAQMALREKLFERRFEFYCEMKRIFSEEQNDKAGILALSDEANKLMLSARFLFPLDVRKAMRPALMQIKALDEVKRKRNAGETDEEHAARIKSAKATLGTHSDEFSDKMEEYMRLYDIAAEEEQPTIAPQAEKSPRRWLSSWARL